MHVIPDYQYKRLAVVHALNFNFIHAHAQCACRQFRATNAWITWKTLDFILKVVGPLTRSPRAGWGYATITFSSCVEVQGDVRNSWMSCEFRNLQHLSLCLPVALPPCLACKLCFYWGPLKSLLFFTICALQITYLLALVVNQPP